MSPLAELLTGTGLVTSWWNVLRPASAESGATSSSIPSVGASPTARSKSANLALREIAARYDVTKITPSQFSQLLQQLQQAGALSEADRQLLAQILVDLHQEGIAPNETVDLVRLYTKKVEKLQDSLQNITHDPQTRSQLGMMLAEMQKRLDWLRRLALLHHSPELANFNLLS